jgi:hypothetical protein
LTPADERRHVVDGSRSNEVPGGAGTVRLVARSPGTAGDVWERSRQVMIAVLDHSESSWPTLDQWRSILPRWFIDASGEEMSDAEAEDWLTWWRSLPPDEQAPATQDQKWTLADWLYWLEPAQREWFWWNAAVANPDTVHVDVQVRGWPAPLGALDWLLRASGSTEVVVEGL